MKFIFLFSILITFSLVSEAQKLQRAFGFGNTGEEYGRKIVYDAQGNMFVVGSFQGNNLDVDPSQATFNLNSSGSWDVFIAKYDAYGIFLNAISVGGSQNDQATSIAIDDTGNIYVTGWFRGTVDFNPSPTNIANVISNGHSGNDMGYDGEIFLAKYTNDLNYSWAFGIGGPFVNDAGLAVKVDKQGDVILAGNFRGLNVDFDPSANVAALSAAGVIESFIAKYTSAGNYVWAKGIGGASTVSGQVRDIAIDNANNIYAVGHFDGSVDLNPGTGTNTVASAGCGDIYLLKLSAAGDYKWGFKVGGSNCDYPVSIVLDNAANVYISGYFSSNNVDFNPGTATTLLSTTGTTYDIFMAKYDSTGAYMFAKKVGGLGSDIGYDMAIRSDGFVLVGYFSKTVDFDPSSATHALTSANDSTDGFIAQYTFDGEYVSAFKIGSTGDDAVYGIHADSKDVITVTGFYTHSNVDFDPSSGKYYLPGGINRDVFIAKYYDLNVRNIVKGSVFIDRNSDGIKDSNEPYFIGAKLISIKNTEDTVITISSNGRFAFAIDTGQYITTPGLQVPYYTIVPGSDTTNFSTYMNTDSVSFAAQPIPGIKDLAVAAFALSPARPGFPVYYKLVYANKGTEIINSASLHFIKDGRLSFDSASIDPLTVNGDTLKWNFTNVAPLSVGSIILYFKAVTPPVLNFADTLSSSTIIYPIIDDSTASDNVFALKQVVTGSYDPNDKRENHGGKITTTQVAERDFLHYTIRFQNTGTDTAFNIIIRDTLSNNLDWNTLEIISVSHDYQFFQVDGNKCSWHFTGINLVDSNKNEPLSHGYIVFKIKPKSSLAAGDIITNRVSIYFDFNLPVETNVEQTIVEMPAILPLTLLNFTAKRNGRVNQLQWKTANEINVGYFEIQRSSNGRDFVTLGTINSQIGSEQKTYVFSDNLPLKSSNYYRLKIVDKDGKVEFSSIRLINNESILGAEIFPSIVADVLNVRISAEQKTDATLSILGLDGKIYMVKKLSLTEGITSFTLNVSFLSSGNYFTRIHTAKEQIVIKFIK